MIGRNFPRARSLSFVLSTLLLLFAGSESAVAALPTTSSPTLRLARTIKTTPFAGSTVSMGDGEGSAYVPRDNSLWLADDGKDGVYAVNPTTGAFKRMIGREAFAAAPRFGGGSPAGPSRAGDLESLAYDAATDSLYAFSGSCCTSAALPTAFLLTRSGGFFHVDSFQPLPSGTNFTAAAWNASDRRVYVGSGGAIRTYDYPTGVSGSRLSVQGVTGILGLGFSPDGADLFVVTSAERLYRVSWPSRTIVAGWIFDLVPFGVRDSRAVELIGSQFYVLDGYPRPSGDPLRNAVFVFNVV